MTELEKTTMTTKPTNGMYIFTDIKTAVEFWNYTMMHEPAVGGFGDGDLVTNPTPATVAMSVLGIPTRIAYQRESMYSTPPFPGGWRTDDCEKVAQFLRAFADAIAPKVENEVQP